MKSVFDFHSLVQLRQEDKLFSLLNKGKLFELFIAFLYEVYDKKENKELQQSVFISLFTNFCSRNADVFLAEGIEVPSADNALRLMMSDGYGLIARRILWDGNEEEADYWLIPTETYVDAVHLLEERGQYSSIGSNLEIRDTILAVRNAADVISGDVEKQKESLRKKIADMQKELAVLEKTGETKPLSVEEVREQVYYIRRCVKNITTTLSRGTSYFKDECSSYWEGMAKSLSNTDNVEKDTNGSVALKVLQGLSDFLKSNAVKSYEGALELLISPTEQQDMADSFDTIVKNPEVRKIMREDDIDMRKILRKVVRDSSECYDIIHKEISRLNAYMRSGEVERNRLLYKKADEILLFWKENKNKVPIRRYLFTVPGVVPRVMSPARLAEKMPKAKLALIHQPIGSSLTVEKKEKSVSSYRDIRVVDIPGKFRRLLDKHKGRFTLLDYVKEEGTSFGVYEFLVIRFIMVRYMGKDMVLKNLSLPKESFTITDFAPKDKNLDFKEVILSAHGFEFDEEAYNKWKKDKFKI